MTEPYVKLLPVFKTYLWGGKKLVNIYDKYDEYDNIAESWILSAHPDGENIVATGKYKGVPFHSYLEAMGREILGSKCEEYSSFPLLIKMIDANSNLSVQVHPNDKYAGKYEHCSGKDEIWYILDCEPGACVYIGFNKTVSRQEVECKAKNSTILDILNMVPTKPGDVFCIPAGTVHAIGRGNLICEIQQNSNVTYRLFDFDRKDSDGKTRELHVDKALEVIEYGVYNIKHKNDKMMKYENTLCECAHFSVKIYEVQDCITISIDTSRFISMVCLEGQAIVEITGKREFVEMGTCIFIPAQQGEVTCHGNAKLVICYV